MLKLVCYLNFSNHLAACHWSGVLLQDDRDTDIGVKKFNPCGSRADAIASAEQAAQLLSAQLVWRE